MSKWLGDYVSGEPVYSKFTTNDLNQVGSTVVNGTVLVYSDNGTTGTSEGVTFSKDIASTTGWHQLEVDTTGATFTTKTDYQLAFSDGTVGGTSVVGKTIREFSIENRFADVGPISSGAAAIGIEAESYVLTTGTQSANTYADTATVDNVLHQHTDDGGALELYYQYDVTGNGVATGVRVVGRINGANDDLDGIYAYNWTGASWDRLGDFEGQNSSTDVTREYILLTRNTGTGANLGKVRIRFYAASGLTNATLSVDQIVTEYSVVAESVGYANGAIWIDTTDGTAGTEAYVNGVADKPVLTLADALTLASSLNLHRFEMEPSSSIQLVATINGALLSGHGWTLDTNGQDIDECHFFDCAVSGVATAATEMEFHDCEITTASHQKAHYYDCTFDGTVTWTLAGDYHIINSQSGVAGSGSPTFTKTAGQAITAEFRRWSGGVTMSGIESGDTLTISGELGTVTLNGADGTVEIRGTYKSIVDNRTGSPTLNTDGAIKGVDVASILTDTGTTLPATLTTIDTNVDTINTNVSALNDISVANIFAGGDIDGYTLEEVLKLIASACAGVLAGAATTTVTVEAVDGSKTRLTATVDADGNRSAVVKDATG